MLDEVSLVCTAMVLLRATLCKMTRKTTKNITKMKRDKKNDDDDGAGTCELDAYDMWV